MSFNSDEKKELRQDIKSLIGSVGEVKGAMSKLPCQNHSRAISSTNKRVNRFYILMLGSLVSIISVLVYINFA